MKWLSIIIIITILGAGCNKDCDDCGELSERQYGLINNFEKQILLSITGNSLLGVTVKPNDTTQLWSTLIDPRTCCCEDTYFFQNSLNNSFPFNAEQITVFIGAEEIGTFSRCEYAANCSVSIFEPHLIGSDGIAYFEVDSLSLCLK